MRGRLKSNEILTVLAAFYSNCYEVRDWRFPIMGIEWNIKLEESNVAFDNNIIKIW